jgi:hypothetical protein
MRRQFSFPTLAAIAATVLGLMDGGTAAADESDVVIEWNQLLQQHIPASASLATPRYYAMMHIAVFDAVNSIERHYSPYRASTAAASGASTQAAAAQAAHDVLVALIPAGQSAFDAALAAQLTGIAPGTAALGSRVGSRVAASILSWRQGDGTISTGPAYVLPELPGLWQPTPPAFQPAAFPHFGEVPPFALLTPTQFLPRRPPTLDSAEYAAHFNEVKHLGSATSATRSAEQTLLARLFAPSGYSTQHWAVWNNVARDAAQRHDWSLLETARLFVLVNASIHDGLQTAHTSKFVYGLWRPVTAIRRAAEDLNPDTDADASWTPLITTPPYPSHSSNQTCVGSSAAQALSRAFGTDVADFTVTWVGSAGNANVSRAYSSYWQLAEDQARSRIYAGIHFTFELTASQESCALVADYVFENYMRPRRASELN